jgi:outer membrane receptor protein involved in Fe transport
MWPGDTQAVWPLEGDSSISPPANSVPVSQAYLNACNESTRLLDNDKVAMNAPNMRFDLDNLMLGITVNWDINENYSLKSITGYGDQKLSGNFAQPDNDGTAMVLSSRYRLSPSERDQFSQELQLSGSAFDQRFNYTAGLFAMVENIDDGATYIFSSVAGMYIPQSRAIIDDLLIISPPTSEKNTFDLKNTTYAAFFQGSYDFTDNLQLTLGLRWTREKREQELTQQLIDKAQFNQTLLGLFPEFIESFGALPLSNYDLADDLLTTVNNAFVENENGIMYPFTDPYTDNISKSWNKFSPMATLSYNFAEETLQAGFIDTAMLYFTYSEGFKSGTFEPIGDISQNGFSKVDPEVVKNYEFGFKLDGFERRMRLNAALYHMKYDDMQLRQVVFDPTTSQPLVTLTNASKSTITGAELELTVHATQQLMLFASASYNEYEYQEFDDVQFSTYHLLARLDLPPVDRSDENFAEVPETTITFGIQYHWLSPIGTITPRLDYLYTSEIFMGLDAGAWLVKDQATFDAYELFNARLSWLLPDEQFELTAYVNNLTDKEYFYGSMAVGDSIGGFAVSKAPPRMYGAELRYHF